MSFTLQKSVGFFCDIWFSSEKQDQWSKDFSCLVKITIRLKTKCVFFFLLCVLCVASLVPVTCLLAAAGVNQARPQSSYPGRLTFAGPRRRRQLAWCGWACRRRRAAGVRLAKFDGGLPDGRDVDLCPCGGGCWLWLACSASSSLSESPAGYTG